MALYHAPTFDRKNYVYDDDIAKGVKQDSEGSSEGN